MQFFIEKAPFLCHNNELMTAQSDLVTTEFVLATKLYMPPTRDDLISRAHLVERLQIGFQQSLTLLCAPAGFGKSTLLSAWARQTDHPVAWLSLDETDNEPVQFMRYFLAAIQTRHPDFGQDIASALQSTQSPPLQSLIPPLLNAIHAIPERFALVLDDYHLIESQPIHSALTFLLLHMPPSLHLVISSRADPPFPLSRLRVHGQLTEFRVADLRFSGQEIAHFFERGQTLQLNHEQLTVLETKTEGWVAGLQLAALSMSNRNAQQIDQFVTAFQGDHHYIFDYLAEEVLAQQAEEVRLFLLRTSILNHLNSSLCNALTEEENGQKMLERLARTNLFLIPLDEQRHWYRYHHLFADFLCQQLEWEVGPKEIKRLHQTAGEWYKLERLDNEALSHFLAAEDFEAAVLLIEENRLDLLMRGEWQRLSSWLEQLPSALRLGRLGLLLAETWCRLFEAKLEAVAESVQKIEELDKHLPELASELDRSALTGLTGELAAIRSKLYLWQNDHQKAIEAAQQALTHLANDNQFLRAHVTLDLGYSYRAQDQFNAAHKAFAEANRLYQAAGGNTYITQIVLNSQADLYHRQGQLHHAIEIHQKAIQLATKGQDRTSPLAGLAYMGLGRVRYEWNELNLAKQQFMTALELNQRMGLLTVISTNLIALAYVDQAQHKPEAAQQKMEEALQCVQEGHPHIKAITTAHQARLWLRQGNLAAAIGWADASGLPFDGDLNEFNIIPYLSLIRVRIAQGHRQENAQLLQEIADLLERWLPQTDSANRRRRTIELSILGALSLAALNQVDATSDLRQRSLAHLAQALTLAKDGGYIRLFVDEGSPMTALLQQIAIQGVTIPYVTKLTTAFLPTHQTSSATRFSGPAVTALAEPLSKRELEIMRLVADGLTAPQMAAKLIISVHTTRTHLKNIYRKLEVNSRVQAVEKVRSLDLL